MTNIGSTSYKTRTQVMRSKEKLISDYEIQLINLKDSVKTYELLICDIHKKLSDKENMINVLLKEQEESSCQFEMMCKNNQNLKKTLAEKEIEVEELQKEIINLTKTNCTLMEESELICNNSLVTPLKKKLNEMETENSSLHKRLSLTLKENIDFRKRNETNKENIIIEPKTIEKRKNKTLLKKIQKQKKEIEVFKKISRKRKRSKLNINHNKNTKKSTIQENSSHDKELKVKMDPFVSYDKNISNSTISIKKKRMIIIGDKHTKNLGVKLKESLGNDSDICCHTYPNTPLNIIINKANNIIRSEEDIILAVCYNSFSAKEIMSYQTYIYKMIEEAQKKKIIMVVTNIPLRNISEQNSQYIYKLNEFIYKINNKLASLSILDSKIYVCNINNSNINFSEFKNIIEYNLLNLYNNLNILKNSLNFNANFPLMTEIVTQK